MNNALTELKENLKLIEIKNEQDKEKVQLIENLLDNENCFFDLDMNTALNILIYLGIEKDNVLPYYYELIKPENYKKVPKVMNIV